MRARRGAGLEGEGDCGGVVGLTGGGPLAGAVAEGAGAGWGGSRDSAMWAVVVVLGGRGAEPALRAKAIAAALLD
ncbi:hypothetical protein GCM10022380_31180 [Amycolatopsis tucumanensis]|uniref:Uncharacterized protein n=1 Tax=Amycolatopsis tucumanensis TaxID=401106 RepID=A0ABP7I527_9PSEU